MGPLDVTLIEVQIPPGEGTIMTTLLEILPFEAIHERVRTACRSRSSWSVLNKLRSAAVL
jgi:hypothetical protein